MKRICWLLIIAVSLVAGRPAAHGSYAGGSEFGKLVMDPTVSDNIALLFDQFDTELVLCLEGEWRGDDLHVTDFRMPHILVSETGRVQAAGCKSGTRSVGTWHNHPAPASSFASSNPEILARNCYLSRTDIIDFRRREEALVTVVSCAPRTYAFWRRSDVESAASDVAVLPPPEDQLVRSEIGGDPAASALTQARRR